jgi:hypothetical protein
MRALIFRPGAPPRVEDIVVTVDTLRLLVGGPIGWTSFAPNIALYHRDVWRNLEPCAIDIRNGRLMNGPLVFLGLSGPDERSLTDDELQLLADTIRGVYLVKKESGVIFGSTAAAIARISAPGGDA